MIEEDSAIENFGLTPNLTDAMPLVQLSRDDFSRLATVPSFDMLPSEKRRERIERARLVILKAWLIPGNRKWSFEWNGVPISASISDTSFFDKLARREILLGQGDALDVELRYEQEYDEALGVYVNDARTYNVVRIIAPVPRARQGELPVTD